MKIWIVSFAALVAAGLMVAPEIASRTCGVTLGGLGALIWTFQRRKLISRNQA